MKDGVPAYDYNFLGLQRTTIASAKKLAPGKAKLALRSSTTTAAARPRAATARCSSMTRRSPKAASTVTQAGMFSADETADVGIDLGTPVVEAIGAEAKSRFTGRIPKLTVQVQ